MNLDEQNQDEQKNQENQKRQDLFSQFKQNILNQINELKIDSEEKNTIENLISAQITVAILKSKIMTKLNEKTTLNYLHFQVNNRTKTHAERNDNKAIKVLHAIFNKTSSMLFELGAIIPLLHSIDSYFIQYQDKDSHSWDFNGATSNFVNHYTHMTPYALGIYTSIYTFGLTSRLISKIPHWYFSKEHKKNENANTIVDNIEKIDSQFFEIYNDILNFCIKYNDQCKNHKQRNNANYQAVNQDENGQDQALINLSKKEIDELDQRIDKIVNENWKKLEEKSEDPKCVVEILSTIFVETKNALFLK